MRLRRSSRRTRIGRGADGAYRDAIGFRAYGYSRQSVVASEFRNGSHEVTLTPFQPKALYLSFYGIGSSKLREAALDLADKTEVNAVVIDVKGDRGGVAFQSSVPLAAKVGAQNLITIRDAKALLDRLHEKRIYALLRSQECILDQCCQGSKTLFPQPARCFDASWRRD